MPIELSPSRVLPPSDKPPPESLRSSTPAGGGRIVKQSGGWSRNPTPKNPSPTATSGPTRGSPAATACPSLAAKPSATAPTSSTSSNASPPSTTASPTPNTHGRSPHSAPKHWPPARRCSTSCASGSPAGQTASAWTWPTASSNTTTTASLSPSAPGNTSSRESAPNSPRQRSLPNGGGPTSRCRPASTWTSTSTGAGTAVRTATTCCCVIRIRRWTTRVTPVTSTPIPALLSHRSSNNICRSCTTANEPAAPSTSSRAITTHCAWHRGLPSASSRWRTACC